MAAVQMFRTTHKSIQLGKAVAYGILLVSIGIILSVVVDTESARDAGGIVGGFLKESVLVPLFGRLSAMLIACFTLLLSIMLLTQNSLVDIIGSTKRNLIELKKSLLPAVHNRLKELQEKGQTQRRKHQEREKRLHSATDHGEERTQKRSCGQTAG